MRRDRKHRSNRQNIRDPRNRFREENPGKRVEDEGKIEVKVTEDQVNRGYWYATISEKLLKFGIFLNNPFHRFNSNLVFYLYAILTAFIPVVIGWAMKKIGLVFARKAFFFTEGKIPVKRGEQDKMRADKYEGKHAERYIDKRNDMVSRKLMKEDAKNNQYLKGE